MHGVGVNKYLQLFRTGNAVMGIIGVTVASFMAAGTGIADAWVNLLISAVVVFMFICGGNALNDYIDSEIDKTAHPERPIPSGRMTRKAALRAAVVMLGGAVVVSFLTVDAECILIVVIACVLMVAYEMALKQRGFVGNVTIAVLTGMMFLLGGAVVGDAADNVIVALMALLVSVGREIAKDIEDMESDEGDRLTLPMRIGPRKGGSDAVALLRAPVLRCGRRRRGVRLLRGHGVLQPPQGPEVRQAGHGGCAGGLHTGCVQVLIPHPAYTPPTFPNHERGRSRRVEEDGRRQGP